LVNYILFKKWLEMKLGSDKLKSLSLKLGREKLKAYISVADGESR
jgi:phosphatidate phosphatase PAH1